MPDSDAGWQEHQEALGKPGAVESDCDISGTKVRIVYHWEYPIVGDQEDKNSPYPVIDEAFVGDEHKLFNVTSLVDDAHNEVITETLMKQRLEGEMEAEIERGRQRRGL